MKKIMASLLSIFFIFPVVFSPVTVIAQTPTSTVECEGATRDSAFCKEQNSLGNPLFGTDGVMTKAAQVIAIITGIVSMFILTIAGLRFITSGGDPAKIESARMAIIYSAVGLIVAISAQAIVSLVLNNL